MASFTASLFCSVLLISLGGLPFPEGKWRRSAFGRENRWDSGGGGADRSEVLGGCCPDDCMREENRKKKEL